MPNNLFDGKISLGNGLVPPGSKLISELVLTKISKAIWNNLATTN